MENISKCDIDCGWSTRGSSKFGRVYEHAGYSKEGSRQSAVLCSIKKCKDIERGVGYLRLGVLVDASLISASQLCDNHQEK